MAKGQKRSNRETMKPKQKKASAAAPATFEKGPSTLIGTSKQKGWPAVVKGRSNA